MRITLVNPPVKKVVEVFFDKPKYPHISIGYLAGYLESKKVPCRVIDAKLERIDDSEVIKRCIGEDIVGITSLTHEICSTAELAGKIKKASPNTMIVIGGAHATSLPKETMEAFPVFDCLVYGEGEETLYELAKAVGGEDGFEKIKGIVFRKGGKIIANEPRIEEQELDNLPWPAWHLFPKAREYPIITARGCPFNCVFCMRAHGKKVRKRSADDVVREMQMLADKYRTRYVYIYDETFTLFKDRANEICEKMIKQGINRKFRWEAETRVNCVDLETLRKMKRAGCVLVKYGIEAGNPEILKGTKKGITIEEAEAAVRMAKQAGIRTQGLFILGHPNETRKTMQDTVNLAVKLNTSTVAFGIMTPYPGTEVYEMARKGEGGYKLLSFDWKDYNKQLGNALEFTGITRKEMEKIQFWGYMKFYFCNFKMREIIKNIAGNHKLAFAIIKKILRKEN